jgi:AcrR family transcriptional regulator
VARPKSEDKKLALLEAATTAFAQSGIAASTAVIARNAGVAEGTLFRYFATKDDLINELYLHLKHDLCQSMMANLDRSVTDAKTMTHYIWNSYISWGLNHTCGHRTIRQLAVSEKSAKKQNSRPTICSRNCAIFVIAPCDLSLCLTNIAPSAMAFFSLWRKPPWNLQPATLPAKEYISMGFEAMWRA